MEQIQTDVSQSAPNSEWDFRQFVDAATVFGCIPALVLTVIFWAVATAFPPMSGVMSLLITLLQALMGIILVIRYVDVCVLNGRAYNGTISEDRLMASLGAGTICLFVAVSMVVCLSTAGTLEGWHYTLMVTEVLLVGYQTWRVFLSNR